MQEVDELVVGVERKDVRDILTGANDDHRTVFPVQATPVEDIAGRIGAECLFAVEETERPLPRK